MSAERPSPSPPWYRRRRNQALVALVIVMLLAAAYPFGKGPPPTDDQVALAGTMKYFGNSYDFATGLIPETPNGTTFWLYSDNYLASIAISRYAQTDQTAAKFATALAYAVEGYSTTFPGGNIPNQYTALNSTSASFNCSANYRMSWSGAGGAPSSANASRTIMTTVSDGSDSCASVSQNYADVLFLEAVYFHKTGNPAQAAAFYQAGARDYDGTGIADSAYSNSTSSSYHVYQTYKLSLYLYAMECDGQAGTDPNYAAVHSKLLVLQDSATGGFFTGYGGGLAPSLSGVNTETTALAALALELVVSPGSTC